MPKTYTLRLNSTERISGNINNATYNINLSNLLPKEVEYWKVQMYLTTNIGWYIDVINNGTFAQTTDINSGFVEIGNLKTLSLDTNNNSQNRYVGHIRRELSMNNCLNNNVNTQSEVAFYYADPNTAPPITIRRPDDSLLQVSIFRNREFTTLLTNTSNGGAFTADMTDYFMILSFEECY
jgi:hypothetical protein